MFIQVRSSNPGHSGRWVAGRQFLNGTAYRLEVVEGDDFKKDELGNGPLNADGAPDIERISRSGVAQIKADPVMSVMEGGDTEAFLSQAAFDGARAQLKRANEELADAKIRIAELEAENLDLTAQLSALTAPPPDAGTEGDDKGGKNKGGKKP